MNLMGQNITMVDMPSYLPDELYPEKIDFIAQSILNSKLQAQSQPVQTADIGNKESGGTNQWQ